MKVIKKQTKPTKKTIQKIYSILLSFQTHQQSPTTKNKTRRKLSKKTDRSIKSHQNTQNPQTKSSINTKIATFNKKTDKNRHSLMPTMLLSMLLVLKMTAFLRKSNKVRQNHATIANMKKWID